jgi:exodeoxyribonuclease-3
VRARIDNLLHWLQEANADIVCLQEIKTQDDGFPRLEVEALGYHVETLGQKGFNGVAILSKLRSRALHRGRVLDRQGCAEGGVALSAERQPDR